VEGVASRLLKVSKLREGAVPRLLLVSKLGEGAVPRLLLISKIGEEADPRLLVASLPVRQDDVGTPLPLARGRVGVGVS